MFEILLHTGHEHPNLWWVVVPSLLSFLAGLGIGSYAGRIQGWFQRGDRTPNE